MTASDARPPDVCPTLCDSDCDARCHEEHEMAWRREHQPKDCPTSDARPPSDVCNCHTYGHARLCPVHTQADYDAAELTRERPPSDTGTTGWHRHGEQNSAWRDGEDRDCEHIAGPSRPVLVVDPAEARDTVLRAVHNAVTRRGAGEDWDADDYHAVTNHVLAALAGQGQP